MIFENTNVYNLSRAVYSARNAMDSWDKSGSDFENDILCENDKALAQRLIKAGSSHRKCLRQIFVSVDITAPRYWWCEFDTYKIGVTSQSCSTMHRLKSYPITLDMFEIDSKNRDNEYWEKTIEYLECLRQKYIETNDYKWFRKLKQALPESFLQRRTITMNYENVLNMKHQRKQHNLKEWNTDFINWCKTLPYAKELLSANNGGA